MSEILVTRDEAQKEWESCAYIKHLPFDEKCYRTITALYDHRDALLKVLKDARVEVYNAVYNECRGPDTYCAERAKNSVADIDAAIALVEGSTALETSTAQGSEAAQMAAGDDK
jgi:hypothetical protein